MAKKNRQKHSSNAKSAHPAQKPEGAKPASTDRKPGFFQTPLGIASGIFVLAFIVLFLYFALPLFSGNSGASNGDTVLVNYLGRFEDGTVFDTNIEESAKAAGIYSSAREYYPMEFALGSNAVIPGFEDAIIGMNPGEKKTVRISPEDAYGYPQESMMQNVTVPKYLLEPYERIREKGINETVGSKSSTIYGDAYLVDINSTSALFELRPEIGSRIIFPTGVSAKLLSVGEAPNDELVLLLDANHPLAGQALVFEITLVDLKKPPAPSSS